MPRRCFDRLSRGLGEPEVAYIYALVHPISKQVRYVGKTHCDPKDRYHLHLSAARKGKTTPVAIWIASLLAHQAVPEIIVLETVPYRDWPQAEAKWVRVFTLLCCDLLNRAGPGGGR
jgi:hypothetical protein